MRCLFLGIWRFMSNTPTPPALKPIHIGPVQIDSPVVLAPMTAVTDLPLRRWCAVMARA
jgi:hypothetical protein